MKSRWTSSGMVFGVVAFALVVSACAAEEPLAIGESAPLESTTLDASITVTQVAPSDFDTLGLEGLFGGSLPEGIPWVADYRIDLASGTRADFSWDAVPALTSTAWVARTDNGNRVGATSVASSAVDWCPGYEAELPDDVVGTYCQVFVLPEGRDIEKVTVNDVATWAID